MIQKLIESVVVEPGPIQCKAELIQRDRLVEVIGGAVFNRLKRGLRRGLAGQHNALGQRAAPTGLAQKFNAFCEAVLGRRQAQIQQHNANCPIAHEHRQAIVAVGGLVDLKALKFNLPAQHLPKIKLVFHDQYPQWRRRGVFSHRCTCSKLAI